MSSIGRIFILFIFISIAVINYSHAASLTRDQLEADAIVNNYFSALTQGDTNTIKSLLGGDFLEKRKRLLDNPTYPEHLIGIYNNARIDITNNVISNDSITVDTVITLNSGETMNLKYILKKDSTRGGRYTIHSELTPEDLKF